MTERSPLAAACLALVLALVLAPGVAQAVGQVDTPGQRPETIESLALDLVQGERAERRYAARTLRDQLRSAVRRSNRAADDMLKDEALLTLQRYDDSVAPACIDVLSEPEVTAACADMLAALLTTDALPALQAALAAEQRSRIQRRLQGAIELLQGELALESQDQAESPDPSR